MGEGIVQAITKVVDLLSRRLHQIGIPTRFNTESGFFLSGEKQKKTYTLSMAHYKTTKKLSAIDAAYIAGLIDGEGTITLSHRHSNENRHLVVSISNTEKPVLTFCIEKIGTGKITNKRTSKQHHTPSFTYTVSNRQALSLLEQITPYLLTYKNKRAKMVLQDYIRLTPRNGRYTDKLFGERQEFVKIFLATKATF